MTDSKTVVEDLAAWLTAVWDVEERLASEEVELVADVFRDSDYTHEYHWQRITYRPSWSGRSSNSAPGAPSPSQVLARIAADRKILALHSFHMVSSLDSRLQPIPGSRRPHCDTCASQDENGEDWPCVTVRLLAEPQADKPGFRPEWLVERQGVEQ